MLAEWHTMNASGWVSPRPMLIGSRICLTLISVISVEETAIQGGACLVEPEFGGVRHEERVGNKRGEGEIQRRMASFVIDAISGHE